MYRQNDALFDKHRSVLLIDFIAHGNHDRLELGEGGDGVLLGGSYVIIGLLFPVVAEKPVNDFLRPPALMVVGYLLSVGGDA